MSDGGRLALTAGEVRATVSPHEGGRISSLVVGGDELLVTQGDSPLAWGSYPLVPFGGRIRDGRFRFDGRAFQLPLNLPPWAIHGTGFTRPWSIVDATTIATGLGADWPFRGQVSQRFELAADRLTVTMTLLAEERMPAVLGWHPWFRRRLVGTADAPLPRSASIELDLDAAAMYVRDGDGLPTGELVPPTPGPWDDCFTGLRADPRITWPDRLGLESSSSADHWVVFTEPAHAICVEPQTGPPDFVHLPDPTIVDAGGSLTATMTLRWWSLAEG